MRSIQRVLGVLLLMAMLLSCVCASAENGDIMPITDFPQPEEFTDILVNLPNPFISWEGLEVTLENWTDRVSQIQQILQYYMHGYLPSTDDITASLSITKAQDGYGAVENEGLAEVTVSKNGIAAPTTIKMAYLLPDPDVFPMPEGGYPVMLVNGFIWGDVPPSVGNYLSLVTEFGIAVLVIDVKSIDSGDNEGGSYKANNRNGVVNDIFNIVDMMPNASRTEFSAGNENNRWLPPYIEPGNEGDANAPSLMLSQTWGLSRVLDALEADMLLPEGERLLSLNSLKSGITGMSRLGKLAMVAGAFEPRFAVVNPVSSGSGGAAIDRFTSVAVNEQQFLGLEPSMGGEYPINKYYYYVKIEDMYKDGTYRATAVLPADALIDVEGRLDGGTSDESEYQDYDSFQDFISGVKVAVGEINPQARGDQAGLTTGVGHGDNIKPGYAVINFGIQTGEGAEQGWHQGTQNYTDVRWGYGSWFTPRFRQWPILEQFANVDIIKRSNRGEYGYLATVPFDQHFLMALIAPRGLLIQDGYLSNNTNPEGTYMGYLAGREIYRFLGAQDQIGLNMHLINHANPVREIVELGEFMTAVINKASVDEKFSYQPFPLNDPRSLYDYSKLDWAAPGFVSIKDQVEALGITLTDVPAKSIYAE